MSVSMYMGLPGAGKTTLLSSFAVKALKKNSRYQNVYCNVKLNIDGIIYVSIDDIGKRRIHDGLLLLDESSVEFNGRMYKQTEKRIIDFFLLHRHWNLDICTFSQANNIDKTIRDVADRCYYIYKGIFTGHWFTRYYRIPYTIIIPEKGDTGENAGQIISGYYKPARFAKIFGGWIYRPKYYKYFDSWEVPELEELPRGRTWQHEKTKKEEEYLDKLPKLPLKKADLWRMNPKYEKIVSDDERKKDEEILKL